MCRIGLTYLSFVFLSFCPLKTYFIRKKKTVGKVLICREPGHCIDQWVSFSLLLKLNLVALDISFIVSIKESNTMRSVWLCPDVAHFIGLTADFKILSNVRVPVFTEYTRQLLMRKCLFAALANYGLRVWSVKLTQKASFPSPYFKRCAP